MQNRGYIRDYKSKLDWEWFTHPNTAHLFEYLCLAANFEDSKWQGIAVKRGQLITSINRISVETGLTVSQIRTALKNLESSKAIHKRSTNGYTLITILNYGIYQSTNAFASKLANELAIELANELTSEPAGELAGELTPIKEINKINKEKNTLKSIPKEKRNGFKKPSVDEISDYCILRNNGVDAHKFFDFYEAKDWMIGKNKMKDWKAAVRTWERNSSQEKSNSEPEHEYWGDCSWKKF